jgi:predicted nucleic acid-binding protein
MRVLVDTTVWSLVIRRRAPDLVLRKAVEELIAQNAVEIIGPIRQECLSGAKDLNQYASFRTFLRGFPDLPLITDDYELAASFFNTCRSKGIQGSHIDFLICAVADRAKLQIFTTDLDFDRYAKLIPIRRFNP